MRLALAFAAALGLAGLSTSLPVSEVHAQDTASFNDKFKISVTRTGEDLTIKVEGIELADAATKAKTQWYVNRDYPLSLKLTAGKAALGKAELVKDDAAFEGTWRLRMGEHVIAAGARREMLRHLFLSHLIHHRGQMTVYLRLLGVAVPPVYGPTADEGRIG